MTPLLSHPATLWLISFTIGVVVLSFTPPRSLIRLGCFPTLCINVWTMLQSRQTVNYTHPMYANLLGGSVFTLALQYFNLVVLRNSTYEAAGPTTTPEGAPFTRLATHEKKILASDLQRPFSLQQICRRLAWGVSHFFDSRLSGTPWEVKNVPPFSSTDPSYVPSKTVFLRNNALCCIISVLLLDLARPSDNTADNAVLFANDKVPIFSQLSSVTREDIAMRFITTIASTTMTYLLFQAMYSAGAVVMVGLCLSSPWRWRPLFGNVLDAYSLRRAWGLFWHQGMSNCLTGPARFFTFRVLRLPQRSLVGRYIFTAIVFALSGAMHICGEVTAGISLSESGVVQFFVTQALGLLIEDAVVWAWGALHRGRDGKARWWERCVGFVWVVTWLAWSMPLWTYPAARRSQGEGILPFSIVDRFTTL